MVFFKMQILAVSIFIISTAREQTKLWTGAHLAKSRQTGKYKGTEEQEMQKKKTLLC